MTRNHVRRPSRLDSSQIIFVAALIAGAATGCTGAATPAPTVSVVPPAGPAAPPVIGALTSLPPLRLPRAVHTATRLLDGRVLVVGGCTSHGCGGTPQGGQSEIYDPATRTFAPGPPLGQARAGHTATALADGRVLVVGGYPDEGRPPLASAEIFDPRTGRFEPTGALVAGRGAHSATRLRDGRVLIVGGVTGAAPAGTEIFDPRAGRFGPAAPLPIPRYTHAATALDNGRVLVVGGQIDRTTLTDTAFLYDPVRDSWLAAGRLHQPKYKLAVAPLAGGGALVVGGQTSDAREARIAATELFDPRTSEFRSGPTMVEPRFKISDSVAVLPDGRIVIGGGGSTVEVFADGRLSVLAGRLGGERQFTTATALSDGTVLITGGYDNQTNLTDETFLADPG